MKLYFQWCQEDEIFSPQHQGINELDIFSFILKEKEGEFPLVTLEIQNIYKNFANFHHKNWCFISYQSPVTQEYELLFKGRLCALPQQIQGEKMIINFSMLPSDWQERLQFLHGTLKNSSYWNPFFVDEESQNDPIESLDARSELFFWCRKTGDVRLSNLFWGNSRVDMSSTHFYESLKIRMGEPPLKAVHVTLSAQWLQHYQGETDLSNLIKENFKEGIVNTLNGKDLEEKWWQKSEKIGRSGYWIAESSLQEIDPYFTGNLNLYPAYSSPLWISPKDPVWKGEIPALPQQKKLKRSWYKAKLVLGWLYKRKRYEKIEFTLNHNIQLSSIGYQKVRKLDFHLQNIFSTSEGYPWCPDWKYSKGFQVVYENQVYMNLKDHRSANSFSEDAPYWKKIKDKFITVDLSQTNSFFLSPIGQKCIEHTLEIARAHLAASARSLEIVITGPLERFVHLTCDCSIKITDHRLPGGEVWGKIKALKFVIEGETGKKIAEVTLGVSLGNHENKESFIQESPKVTSDNSYSLEYEHADYCSDFIKGQSISGIKYAFRQNIDSFSNKHQNPYKFRPQDIVEELKISNPASIQNDYLLQTQYPYPTFLEENLRKVPTNIYFKLKDMKSSEVITSYFQLNLPYPWSAPRQINFDFSA